MKPLQATTATLPLPVSICVMHSQQSKSLHVSWPAHLPERKSGDESRSMEERLR